jgi:DNA-binding transcriptional MerR regulator
MPQPTVAEEDPLLTSASAAKLVDRTPETVRAWSRAGRLVPAHTTANGIRLFRRVDVERVAEEIRRGR